MAWCGACRLSENESQPKTETEGTPGPPRAALYIDGFNLYHPIDDSGDHHLKWANLWRLGEILCEQDGAELVKVAFCTAVPGHAPDKRDRHNIFNAAQTACGCEVIKGHHVFEPDKDRYAEKQSDINVALAVVLDGIDDVYDIAFLLTADSDQVATARVFSERLAPLGKRLVGVAPLGRHVPDGYKKYGVKGFALSRFQLERSVMGATVAGRGKAIARPTKYDPPADWIHPDKRRTGRPSKAPKKDAWSKGVRGAH